MKKTVAVWLAVLALVAAVVGCGRSTVPPAAPPVVTPVAPTQPSLPPPVPPTPSAPAPTAAEKPVAPEKNPPGDIPDTQVFVEYVSASGGYGLKAPEGWARQTDGANVTFTDKLDGLSVTLTDQPTAPSVGSVTREQAAALKSGPGAVKIKGVKEVKLPGGVAILLAYQSNSEADPVTGKQVRLDNNSYLFYRQGKLATVRLWAPVGADNVDQWKLISDSFRWR